MMKSTNDSSVNAPKLSITPCPTPLNADLADSMLSEKHFLLIPAPLVSWLWCAKLRPVSKNLFLVYWMDALIRKKKGQPLQSRLTVPYLSSKLNVSEAAVRKSNQELVNAGLLIRENRYNAIGRTVYSLSTICLPTALAEYIDRSPSRTKTPPPNPPSGSADNIQEDEAASITQNDINQELQNESLANDSQQPEPTSMTTINQPQDKQHDIKVLEQKKNGAIVELQSLNSKRCTRDDRLRQQALIKIIQQLSDRIAKTTTPPEQEVKPAKSVKTRLAKQPKTKPHKKASYKPRKLTPRDLDYIAKRISQFSFVSSPRQLVQEVVYHVTQGAYNRPSLPVRKAINISLKVIEQNRWRTPAGFIAIGETAISGGAIPMA